MSKLYNSYLELKEKNSNFIYLFKNGVFFIALDEDAIKLSNISRGTTKICQGNNLVWKGKIIYIKIYIKLRILKKHLREFANTQKTKKKQHILKNINAFIFHAYTIFLKKGNMLLVHIIFFIYMNQKNVEL